MRSFFVVMVIGVGLWLSVGAPRAAIIQPPPGSGQAIERPEQGGGGVSDADDQAEAELTFTTYLDKTAVWVGDQFHYRIFVEHPPTVQFILENVNRDTINLEPLRVVDVTTSTTSLQNGNSRLVVDLLLTHFTTEPELQIPQLTLFYFRRDAAAAVVTSEGAAAESVTIPGPAISVRSALPPGDADLRDAVTVSSWPSGRSIVAGIGWLALVVLIGGLAWEGVGMIRRRGKHEGPDPRKAMSAIRDRWSHSVPADFGSTDVVMEFYGRSYHDLKEYLGYLLETPTEGLLADEMRVEIARLSVEPGLADRAGRVLDVCESTRYDGNQSDLNSDAARALADDMREIFQAGPRS